MSNQTNKQFFLCLLDFSSKVQSQIIEADNIDEALFQADPTFDVQGVQIQWNNFDDKYRRVDRSFSFENLIDRSIGFPGRYQETVFQSAVYWVRVKDSNTKYMIYRVK